MNAIALRIALWLDPPHPVSEVVTENADGSVMVKAVYGSLADAYTVRACMPSCAIRSDGGRCNG